MKYLLILLCFNSFSLCAQIPKSGTYTYNYCDIEYNKCIGKCKVKIKGNKIWIFAPSNLTGIKEGELLENGSLYKHPSGKWTIIHSAKEKLSAKATDADLFIWVDFKKKQYWQF